MDLFQHIAHTVVFAEPDGGVHHQTRDQAKCLVADSEAVRIWDVRGVMHRDTHFLNCRGVHLSIEHLRSYAKEETAVRNAHELVSLTASSTATFPPPYLIFQLAILEESQLVLLFQVVTVDVVEVHLTAQDTPIKTGSH